jgi:hypothetical protein
MVEDLQPGLSARAQAATVDRRLRIALDLHRAPVDDAHAETAPGVAQSTGGEDVLFAASTQPTLDGHGRLFNGIGISTRPAPCRHGGQ